MKQELTTSQYCKVCLLPHDDEMHEATLNVRKWHHWQVVKGFVVDEEQTPGPEELTEPCVA